MLNLDYLAENPSYAHNKDRVKNRNELLKVLGNRFDNMCLKFINNSIGNLKEINDGLVFLNLLIFMKKKQENVNYESL